MKSLSFLFLLFFIPAVLQAQVVTTIAGNDTATITGNGGPATLAHLRNTEGIWMDDYCHLYISDKLDCRIRKVDVNTGTITTIAGTGVAAVSPDNILATDASVHTPYGLYSDATGNVYFAELGSARIRRIDAVSGLITTVAGGGTTLGDGGPATNAEIASFNVYVDNDGIMYIGDKARIRRVALDGIITTIAGTGVVGLSGDGGAATNAQISSAFGMVEDGAGNLYFADRANARVRKIDLNTGIITTVAGTTWGYSGDDGLATNAQLRNPISIALDIAGNLIIGDNENDFIRKVDLNNGKIYKVAGVGLTVGDEGEGAPVLSASIHPEFLYLDQHGYLYFSTFSKKNQVHQRHPRRPQRIWQPLRHRSSPRHHSHTGGAFNLPQSLYR